MALYQISLENHLWKVEERMEFCQAEKEDKPLFWFNKRNNEPIHISIILYHYKAMSEDELIQTISALSKQEHIPNYINTEYIILLDSIHLDDLTLVKNIIAKRQDIIIVETNVKFAGAGLMWNAGLHIASGEKICFTWTGLYWLKDSLYHLNRIIDQENVDGAYGQVKYTGNQSSYSFDVLHSGQLEAHSAWIQTLNCIPLGYTLLKRTLVEQLHGFYHDSALSRIVDWEFMLRASVIGTLKQLRGTPIQAKQSLINVYKNVKFNETVDEIIRFGLKDSVIKAGKKTTPSMLEENISNNIQKTLNKKNKPLKIGIISDLKESTQVQLCLLNYFEYLKKQVSWRWFNEQFIKPSELKGYDLIFFVRSRTDQGVKAAQFCYKKDIKTVYIIDDNWFWATETYPQLSEQIGIHTSAYQNFLFFIATVDHILVYNDLLEQDMRRFNNAVINFPVNVNFKYFTTKKIKQDDHTIRIGYAGSNSKLPFFEPVFRALERIMQQYEHVHLYFKGINLPESFKVFESRIQYAPYVFDYQKYAKELAEARCDIMISPLINTRYINSKCPNKYLEITAAGATGIYSKNQLYERIITDGYNGLIVDNKEEEWLIAFEKLINDPSLRKEMYIHALDDINENYNTKVLVPKFKQLLKQVFNE